jgi:hypothetical protein
MSRNNGRWPSDLGADRQAFRRSLGPPLM